MRSTMRTRAAATVGAVLLAGLLTACNGDGEGGDGFPFGGDKKNVSDQGDGGKGGGKVPAQMVGEWSSTSVSLTQYEDANTGVSAPTNGTGIILTIEKDGSYTEYGLLQTGMYSCQTKLTTHTEGKVSVEGSKVTFKPSSVKTQMTGCGSSDSGEKNGTKVIRTETFSFEKDQYSGKPVMKLTGDDGQTTQYSPSK